MKKMMSSFHINRWTDSKKKIIYLLGYAWLSFLKVKSALLLQNNFLVQKIVWLRRLFYMLFNNKSTLGRLVET